MNTITLDALHAQADKLQDFACQSKRKLTRAKALEQAAQLNGHVNYQTAAAAIEKHKAFRQHFTNQFLQAHANQTRNASNQAQGIHEVRLEGEQHYMGSEVIKKLMGQINPWDSDGHSTNGNFEIDIGQGHISVKLYKEGEENRCLEVVFEMDADQPRALVYRPQKCDEPIFSVHSAQDGAVLQYMAEDDELYRKNRAAEKLVEQIALVAHSTAAWIAPDPEFVA